MRAVFFVHSSKLKFGGFLLVGKTTSYLHTGCGLTNMSAVLPHPASASARGYFAIALRCFLTTWARVSGDMFITESMLKRCEQMSMNDRSSLPGQSQIKVTHFERFQAVRVLPALETAMEIPMKLLTKALLGGAMLALSVGSASAAVVCNEEGDCWRVKETRTYEPSLKLRIMPDDWKWKDSEKDRYRWRESGRGHGYYRKGVWVEIK